MPGGSIYPGTSSGGGGGGSTVNQVPYWSAVAINGNTENIAAGKISFNNADAYNTSAVILSHYAANLTNGTFIRTAQLNAAGGFLYLVSEAGRLLVYQIGAVSNGTLGVQMSVSPLFADSSIATPTSGKVFATFQPVLEFTPLTFASDADGGDYNITITDSSAVGSARDALNSVAPGAGDVLFQTAERLKALTSALASKQYPRYI